MTMKALTPAQQRKAVGFLKRQLAQDDEAPNETGYCDHEETMKLRVFLIEIGAVPDRRKAGKK
jgi:hypothetical protein